MSPGVKHYISQPFLLTPSRRFSNELSLECPECHSKDIMMTIEPGGIGTGPGGRWRMGDSGGTDIDVCNQCGSVRRRIAGERLYSHRGITFAVSPRRDSPNGGLHWHIWLRGEGRWEDSPGAFYDKAEDHPEGAYEWARAACCKFIDKILG
jgi:hypothetical protein